ncbi:hypothetical protein BKI52_29740 [marine bacterium AO1-C]|nr:hypothetical protein BKI52_29740 [marine bacterium AO1-C]
MRKYTEDEVADELKELMDDRTTVQGQKAKIVSVSTVEMECVVKLLSNDLEITGVNLKGHTVNPDNSINQNGFILVPKVDSIVLINLIEDTKKSRWHAGDYYITMYSEIEEVLFKQNDKEVLKIDKDGNFSLMNKDNDSVLKVESGGNVTFHKGENKGLIKIDSLVAKLNALEQKVNDLITDYKGHNHLHPQGPTTAFVTPSVITDLTETQVNDLENDKIKH